jgi:hypothetical protein
MGAEAGCVRRDDPESADHGRVVFPDLTAMLAAIQEALSSGAFVIDPDGYLDETNRWTEIAASHAGSLGYWESRLAELEAWVYIPAPGSQPSVEITLPPVATVGEWVALRARRRNGTWMRVKPRDLPPGVFGQAKPPPPVEDEHVSANLFWQIDPPVPIGHGDGLGRRVRFTVPGVDTIRARSKFPWPAESNVCVLHVEPDGAPRAS